MKQIELEEKVLQLESTVKQLQSQLNEVLKLGDINNKTTTPQRNFQTERANFWADWNLFISNIHNTVDHSSSFECFKQRAENIFTDTAKGDFLTNTLKQLQSQYSNAIATSNPITITVNGNLIYNKGFGYNELNNVRNYINSSTFKNYKGDIIQAYYPIFKYFCLLTEPLDNNENWKDDVVLTSNDGVKWLNPAFVIDQCIAKICNCIEKNEKPVHLQYQTDDMLTKIKSGLIQFKVTVNQNKFPTLSWEELRDLHYNYNKPADDDLPF